MQTETMQAETIQAKPTHWPSILILILLASGILFFLGIASIMSLASVIGLFDNSAPPPVDNMIIAFSAGLEFVLLAVCAWFVFQKVTGKESAEVSAKFPFSVWQVFVIPLIVITCLSIGGLVAIYGNKYLSWFILPLATLLVILPPIFLFVGIGANGLETGARWKIWGTIGIGLTISPLLMIFFEVLILVMAFVVLVIFLAFQPEKLQEFQNFAQLLRNETDQDVILTMLTPYLTDPRVIAAILGYIALLVPLIEEMFKPLAVWLFARSIEKPSHGFVLGMLSGGAFALIESLNASADGSESWPVVASVRAGTSLLHIVLTGFMGYAIVGAFQEKRYKQLFGIYLAVVLLHGIWNASAVGAGLAGIGEMLGKPEWLVAFLPASLCGLVVVGIGIFALLITANRKIRSSLNQE